MLRHRLRVGDSIGGVVRTMDALLVAGEIAREGCHARISETLVARLGVFIVASLLLAVRRRRRVLARGVHPRRIPVRGNHRCLVELETLADGIVDELWQVGSAMR